MSLLSNPSHPGEVLSELYLKPLGMSAIALAKRLDVPRTRIERLIKQETALSANGGLSWLRRAWQCGNLVPLVCNGSVSELLRVLCYPKFRPTANRVHDFKI